jgi:hypothetical protein
MMETQVEAYGNNLNSLIMRMTKIARHSIGVNKQTGTKQLTNQNSQTTALEFDFRKSYSKAVACIFSSIPISSSGARFFDLKCTSQWFHARQKGLRVAYKLSCHSYGIRY